MKMKKKGGILSFVKRIFFLTGVLLLLSGCGNSDTPPEQEIRLGDSEHILIEKEDYRLFLPKNWEIFSPPQQISHQNIVFRRREPHKGTYPNIVQTREDIPPQTTALELAKGSLESESTTLLSFQKINEDSLSLSGQKTLLVEFTAREGSEKRNLRFWQTFLVREQKGIIFTGSAAFDSDKDLQTEIKDIFKSIKIQE